MKLYLIVLGILGISAGFAPMSADAQTCPDVGDARRLVLVTTAGMNASSATMQLLEREPEKGAWRVVHPAERAVVGRAGLGWGIGFHHIARDGEPIKIEGDYRTPAGIYPLGRTFGFDSAARAGHLQIKADTVCVDDPSSPDYNTITSRAKVGSKVRGEDMRKIDLYRRGIVIDYPTDGAAKGGSCIFIHIAPPGGGATVGCVAIPEARISALQDFASDRAIIAILARSAIERFAECLPMNIVKGEQ
jgi:L,D-peptidoglycan transpeptidase YkuD (ErfK/YbiS/YcfS/YnhG family)